MRDLTLMQELLERMAGDPLGRITAMDLVTPEIDHALELLEDEKLVEWVSRYPYGYRLTNLGYDEAERVASTGKPT
ncbi:MAG: hypothetical protein OXQ90_10915 [Gammaproteobacteria bacterium]|nr:hypothetical protein [Gammaproteobacteria bacterium]